eukprot:TRINITY_DN26695_c4_g1_i1.p4 TRINITY_DN26695_c4_g1~~TRINITY_DN26695_c4_g1_i1.p4  ORF type:complete len:107 (-),score=14.16 TRINITY_DN26695_c4_g1_i1:546-866(-)
MGDNNTFEGVNGSNNNERTRCWACNVELMVPQIEGGQYAHEYKCGWCGAFNYWPLTEGSGAVPHNGATNGPQKSTEKYYGRGILGESTDFWTCWTKKLTKNVPRLV